LRHQDHGHYVLRGCALDGGFEFLHRRLQAFDDGLTLAGGAFALQRLRLGFSLGLLDLKDFVGFAAGLRSDLLALRGVDVVHCGFDLGVGNDVSDQRAQNVVAEVVHDFVEIALDGAGDLLHLLESFVEIDTTPKSDVLWQIAILMACWAWAARKFGSKGFMWAAVFLPTAYGIANGQDCALMLLLMIVAYELAERDRLAASGFAIGLALFKFHLLLLFPVLMLISRRWRMLGGYCAAAGVEIAGSFILGGKAGLIEYAKLLQRKDIERLSPSPEMMSNIHAIAANLGIHSTAVSVALAGVVVAIAVYASWNAPLWRWFAAAVAGSLLMVPHVYGYDAAVLLLPILLVIFKGGTKLARYSAMAIALPCVFWLPAAGVPFAMGPALAISIFLISVARDRGSEAVSEWSSPRTELTQFSVS